VTRPARCTYHVTVDNKQPQRTDMKHTRMQTSYLVFGVGLCSSPPLPEIMWSDAVLLLALCVVCSASATAVTPRSGFAQHTPQYARTRMRRAFTSARLCALFFSLAGCEERHCARCHILFTGEDREHAVCRTVCCGRLLCRSCLPDPAFPESCWYCAGQDSCTPGAGTAAVSTGNISFRDEAVAKHLMRQRGAWSSTAR
jgi:hypothetical protein